MKIEGELFRVEIEPQQDRAPLISIYVEDDGNWENRLEFAISWLPELQMLLGSAWQLTVQTASGEPNGT